MWRRPDHHPWPPPSLRRRGHKIQTHATTGTYCRSPFVPNSGRILSLIPDFQCIGVWPSLQNTPNLFLSLSPPPRSSLPSKFSLSQKKWPDRDGRSVVERASNTMQLDSPSDLFHPLCLRAGTVLRAVQGNHTTSPGFFFCTYLSDN